MGAIAAGAPRPTLDAMTDYARHLGLAFQIVDDLLDVTSTPEQLGKATRKDAAKGKTTYPGLIGIEASREEARRQLTSAVGALRGFGDSANGLRQLAEFVVRREI
jgi:geranylgeranyl diphosphate synthase type II